MNTPQPITLAIFYLLGLLNLFPATCIAQETPALTHVKINLHDQPSLQRGARIFVNYCMGCHSLSYMRYNRLAKDLGLMNRQGNVDEQLVKENLIFTGEKIGAPMHNAMQARNARQWFGIAPPDLTLEAKVHSADWIYTYLRSFYQDPTRPWGVNNLIYPNTAMPDVLVQLRGIQLPIYQARTVTVEGVSQTIKTIDHLVLTKPGSMLPVQFDATLIDLVNFLVYASDPLQQERKQLGIWVLLFLILFVILTYLLKTQYWKDVKK